MKLRELLKKVNDSVRPQHVQGSGSNRALDGKDDAAATFDAFGARAGDTAPTNWVPSQQDERPRH
jgi:hypothetical protein